VSSWTSRGHSTIPLNAMVEAARERGLEETCCRWIRSMLESRLVHAFLTGSSLTARVSGGCQTGRSFVSSPV
jgi:hypothetical protein